MAKEKEKIVDEIFLVISGSLSGERILDVGNIRLMTQDSQIDEIVNWVDNVDFVRVEKLFEDRERIE